MFSNKRKYRNNKLFYIKENIIESWIVMKKKNSKHIYNRWSELLEFLSCDVRLRNCVET